MIASPNVRLATALRTFSRLDGQLVALAGLAVLTGWAIGNEALTRVVPGFAAMNPLSAACFIGAGVSLASFWSFEQRPSALKLRFGQILATLLVAFAVLKLLDYLFGWRFRLDEWLFHGRLDSSRGGSPNRMAPTTAFNFMLSGCALFLLSSHIRSWRATQSLSLVVLFHSLLALLGYAYSANYLYGIGPFPMAFNTAALFLLLSLGILFARTEYGAVAVFLSDAPGGIMARRLLPVVVIVPAILGALRLLGEKQGIYKSEFGVTIMVVGSIALFTALIWRNSVLLNRADQLRRQAEADLKKAHDGLEIKVEERSASLRAQMEEREQLEKQFLRVQRMESVGSLAGGIAHDLNNALVPILMGAQMMRMSGADAAEREKLIELITSSGNRCSQMVKQILTFAKGRGATGPLRLGHLIAEMERIAKDTFPKSIAIRTEVAPDLWKIEGDATELHQVLMNLCVNARDAMPNGGQLTLGAANTEIPAETASRHADATAGRHIALSVADTGGGIAPELLGRVFEPFFTTKGPDKGTGLGLSTVAQITKRHKGFIQIHSEVGKGTQFRIFFPATAEAAEATESTRSHSPLPAGNNELILIVDDERSVLELAKSTLESYGYRVLTAPNGLEAIARFEAQHKEVRLVLTDTDMPFMDGRSAINAIRKINPKVPIIIASGTAGDTEHTWLGESAHVFTLQKPYGIEQLLSCVDKALRASASKGE